MATKRKCAFSRCEPTTSKHQLAGAVGSGSASPRAQGARRGRDDVIAWTKPEHLVVGARLSHAPRCFRRSA
jgi:hypothetical protein